MKTIRSFLALCSATLTLSAAHADIDNFSLDYQGADLQIDVVRQPIFPQSLLMNGYTQGKVRVAFEVDYSGELRDWLIVESSHPSFASAVSHVFGSWQFSPPYINGQNRSVVGTLVIDFSAKGSVLSFDISSGLITQRFNEMFGYDSERESVLHAKELDELPRPIESPMPSVPKDSIRKCNGARATFTFYLDEKGAVRIPALKSTDGEIELEMIVAAQDALEQWRFTPPTKNSRPARVKLAQEFVFKEN